MATVADIDAIDQLLLREDKESSGFPLIAALKSTGGSESPAGTAGTLVLDRGNGIVLSPVDGFVGGLQVENEGVGLGVLGVTNNGKISAG